MDDYEVTCLFFCSGSNDHTTKFWCRNRPGDPSRDKHNIGSGELGAAAPGRFAGNFPVPDAPPTPGPFAAGLARSDGTIPGVGTAMPFAMLPLDGSDQGEQRHPIPVSNPMLAPHPPSVPHPSLLQPTQQGYPQVPQQVAGQHQHQPLQPPMMPLPPTTLSQLQPPSQLPLLAHPSHLHRPPPIQFPSLSVPASTPSNALSMPMQSMSVSLPLPMPGSASDSVLPRPTSLQSNNYPPVLAMPGQGLHSSATQIPQLPQPPLGMNQIIAGPMAGSNVPPAINNFSSGMTNTHVPSSTAAGQAFAVSGVFSRPQSGQLALVPGINAYQTGIPSMMDMRPSMALPPNISLPPGPPPHSRGSTS
ncbi:Flowering time control protein [Nymphaea thermarum]|nr:Flowering time control protein [Nymphaea thermarum]